VSSFVLGIVGVEVNGRWQVDASDGSRVVWRGVATDDPCCETFPFACTPEVDAMSPKGLVVPDSVFDLFFNILICFLVKAGVDVDVESTPFVSVGLERSSGLKPSRTSCLNASTTGLKSSVAILSEGSVMYDSA
jgi:hypothetical protein